MILRILIAAASLWLAAIVSSSAGVTRTVTSLNDSGTGTLRDTIAASASGDTINFGVSGTILLTSNDLLIQSKNLTIDNSAGGPGTITVQATSSFRVLQILSSTVTISGLTISNGNTGSHSDGFGGGIANDGTLTLNNCVVTGNHVQPDSVNRGNGGGIYNSGSLTMNNCTVSNNSVHNSNDCVQLFGGGIYNSGTLTMNGCTVNGNGLSYSLVCNPADLGSGIADEGTANITNSTLVGNSVYNASSLTLRSCTLQQSPIGNDGTGGLHPTLNLGNCLMSGANGLTPKTVVNYGAGVVTSAGYNLSNDDASGLLTGTADQPNADPKLDPYGLQNNGGPTKTLALTPGSAAIDQGNSFGSTTDQRGQLRPVDNPGVSSPAGGDASDIGAYESPSDTIQSAPTFIVTTSADHDDGICGGTDCTLREAINRVNAVGGNRTITFAANVTGIITLTGNAFDELSVTSNVTITGPGARVLAVSGNNIQRIFEFDPSVTCTISGLTIRDGNYAPSSDTSGQNHQGGAVFNFGNVTFTDCAFLNNNVTGASNSSNGGAGGSGQGGAIYNRQSLTLERCTFHGNTAIGVAGTNFSSGSLLGPGGNGGSGQGGAVFNNTGALLTAHNCTFSGNTASGGAGGSGNSALRAGGGDGAGGAIFNLASSSGLLIIGTTVSNNAGIGGLGAGSSFSHGPNGAGIGGIFTVSGGQNNAIANTIVAGNTAQNGNAAPDASGPFASSGYNLIGVGDQSSGWNTSNGDQVGTTAAPINPHLGSLQNNGGPTDTMMPLGNSPAIDQGNSFGLTTDQRGVARPFDEPSIPNLSDGSDIGAVETQLQLGPTFIVTTTADHDDGMCTFGDCTLREAINAANAASGPNTITFAPSVVGTITLGSGGELDVTDSTTIIGPGARILAVSGNNTNRVFSFAAGTTTAVSGLTISNGLITSTLLGAQDGGGIFNQATLTLTDCSLHNNQATGANAGFTGNGGSANGGAIYNSAALTLNRCTFNNNSATGGIGGVSFGRTNAGIGGSATGAIFNDTPGTLTITNCTFDNNFANGGGGGSGGSAAGGAGGAGRGGIFNQGTMTVSASTIYDNGGAGGAGGSGSSTGAQGAGTGGLTNTGTATVGDTICAGNTGNSGANSNVNGSFSSTGYNLIGDSTGGTGFTNGVNHDQVGVNDPKLGALQNNGGPTDTMALLSTSSAINAGDPNAPSQDQRYYLRSGVPDVGAFEYQGALAPVSAISRKTHGGTTTFDVALPLIGNAGVECRSGGATGDHRVVLTFPVPVTVNGNPQAQVTTGAGLIGSGGTSNGGVVTISGNTVTVPLTSITNAQRIGVTLSSVSDGANTNNFVVTMVVLAGDTNADTFVDSADIAQAKSQSGQVVTGSNFREDVNVDLFLDSGDIAFVKSKSGTSVPSGAAIPNSPAPAAAPTTRLRPTRAGNNF